MHAPSYSSKNQSSIEIKFGQTVTSQKTPISIDLAFAIFSKANENNRFNLQQMLDVIIGSDTLIVQLKSKSGYGSQLADKVMTFLKSNQLYLKMNSQQKIQIKALGKGDKCFIFVNSKDFSAPFLQISKLCSELGPYKSQNQQQNDLIHLTVGSANSCLQIRKLLDNQGAMRAAFDSLSVNLSFNKTKLVQKVLFNVFEGLQMQNITGPLRAFNNLSLSINFASSQAFDRYQKMRVFGKVFRKIQTFFLGAVKGLFCDEAKLYYFNEVFSFTGRVHGEDIQTLLEALFGEPQAEQ